MVYFVFLKASKPLKSKWKWINYGIRPAIIISLISNLGIIIFLEVEMSVINNDTDVEEKAEAIERLSCTSPLWLISSSFDFLSVIIFMLFIIKLEEHTEEQMKKDENNFGYDGEFY